MGLLQMAPRVGACEHGTTMITVNFGIRRSVCAQCGWVDVDYEGPSETGILFRIPAEATETRAW